MILAAVSIAAVDRLGKEGKLLCRFNDIRRALAAVTPGKAGGHVGHALLIAALSAEGVSTIQNIDQIDRGYRDIDGRLNALGARITRLDE